MPDPKPESFRFGGPANISWISCRRMNLKKSSSLVAATVACFLLFRQLAPRDSFAQKVIVITGGSRGLGLPLARRLAREQARLAILARDEQELGRAKSDLLKYWSGGYDLAVRHQRRIGGAINDSEYRETFRENRCSDQQRGRDCWWSP